MAEIPDGLLYTEEHEYLKPTDEEGVYLVGVTDYAQGELGDVVYLELPSVGETFKQMESMGTIEAVKAVSDIYSPAEIEILEVNTALEDDPSLVNTSPYEDGWMVKVRVLNPEDLDKLMDAAAYAAHIGE